MVSSLRVYLDASFEHHQYFFLAVPKTIVVMVFFLLLLSKIMTSCTQNKKNINFTFYNDDLLVGRSEVKIFVFIKLRKTKTEREIKEFIVRFSV